MGLIGDVVDALLYVALDRDSPLLERAVTIALTPVFGLVGLGAYAWGAAVARDRASGADPDGVHRAVAAKIGRTGRGRRELTRSAVSLWGSDSRREALNWALDDTDSVPVPDFLTDFV